MERFLRRIWTITLVVEIYINGTGANGILDDALKWTDLVIPFAFSKTFLNEPDRRQLVLDAMDVFQKATCLTFVQRTTEMQYLQIFADPLGCSSNFGKQAPNSRGQPVALNINKCFPDDKSAIAQHQIMHAIGFYHEQSRLDRDEYVDINWSNIQPGNIDQFNIYSSTAFGEPYDFGSILHYGMYEFAIDPTVWTIRPKEKYRDQRIGQQNGLSATDIRKINKMYNCTKQLAATTPKLADFKKSTTDHPMPTVSKDEGCCIDNNNHCGSALLSRCSPRQLSAGTLYACAEGSDPVLIRNCPDGCLSQTDGNNICVKTRIISQLAPKTSLERGHSLFSPDKKTRLTMQTDGNLVLSAISSVGQSETVLWSSGTDLLTHSPVSLSVLPSGDIIMLGEPGGDILWRSRTAGSKYRGSSLWVGDGGRLCLAQDVTGPCLWTPVGRLTPHNSAF